MVVTFTFLIVLIPQYNVAKANFKNENILPEIAKEPGFRACLIAENMTCINRSLAGRLGKYDYAINISKSPNSRSENLPEKRVFSESMMISGNSTLYEPRILRVYYWGKG